MKAMRSIQYTLNIIKYTPALSEIPLSEDKTLTSEERSTKKRKGYCLFQERQRERERERERERVRVIQRRHEGSPACQLSIKTRNRIGKRVEGCEAETYRKDPPPLFHRNDVRHPSLPPLLRLLLLSSSSFGRSELLEYLSLSPLGLSFILRLSHPRVCPSHPRTLFSYQIESLYFASSIISFINLRAFRTL